MTLLWNVCIVGDMKKNLGNGSVRYEIKITKTITETYIVEPSDMDLEDGEFWDEQDWVDYCETEVVRKTEVEEVLSADVEPYDSAEDYLDEKWEAEREEKKIGSW